MKVAQISDVHIDYYATRLGAMHLENGINTYHIERIESFANMVKEALASHCDVIVISGDLFNKNKPTPQEYADVLSILDFAAVSVPVYIIPGNHDEITSRGCALQPLIGRRPLIKIALEPTVLVHMGWNFILAPWGTTFSNIKDIRAKIKNNCILVYHTGVMNGTLNWGETADEAATCTLSDLESLDCDAIMLGHYHGQGPLDKANKIWYAGSPECFNFGEERQTKGFLIWNFEQNQLACVDKKLVRSTPSYLTITPDQVQPGYNFDGYLRVKGDVSEHERARIIKTMKLVACSGYKLELTSSEKAQRIIHVAGRTNKEILGNYFASKHISSTQIYFDVDTEIEKEIVNGS